MDNKILMTKKMKMKMKMKRKKKMKTKRKRKILMKMKNGPTTTFISTISKMALNILRARKANLKKHLRSKNEIVL